VSDLVAVDLETCPECQAALLDTLVVHEPTLLRGGGYGATRRVVRLVCTVCGFSHTREVSEVRV